MRQFAMAIAAVLVFALISPAFAQPFADTPTNHWAYDAIAELAAKGLIEGYPDGTFKGDRAMTRYEMAMVVARLLARIESIQIPTPAAPPRPEVTRPDIDSILRLVNEFRAELAAKNVRLTAVEEELNAIKAKLSNVRIAGGVRFREDLEQRPAGAPLNGNPNTTAVSVATTLRGNRPRVGFKLGFDGSVAPDLHLILALTSAQGWQYFNSSNIGFGAGQNGQPQQGAFGSIDSAFLDWKNGFGWPMEVWLGRFGCDTPAAGGCYPVQFGPFGLLLNTSGNTWVESTWNSGNNLADGLRLAFHFANLADLQVQGAWIRVAGNIGSLSYPSGEDAYGIDANLQLMQILRLGGYYVGNSIGNFGSTPFCQPAGAGGSAPCGNILYHVYGPGGPSFNPPLPGRCPVVAGTGFTCPALGNGWGAYAQWDVMPGIHLDVEAAQWSDGVLGGSDSGFKALAAWDLSTIFHICCSVSATTGYQFYGANFYPPYGAAEIDFDLFDYLYPGNAQGFTASVSIKPFMGWTFTANYVTGNNVSNSMTLNSWEANASYAFAPNAKITFKYRDLTMGGVDQKNVYRATIDYSF